MNKITINIFYKEEPVKRWVKYDWIIRDVIRKFFVRKVKTSGHLMVLNNLIKGLDICGINYRLNDFRYVKKNPSEIAVVLGKPYLIDKIKWVNPIVFGPAIFSHPTEYPDLLEKHKNIRAILQPGEWSAEMFKSHFGDVVFPWPVGIDTQFWSPSYKPKEYILIYNKIRWNKKKFDRELILPIKETLQRYSLKWEEIIYGDYFLVELKEKIDRCYAVIFLCEHETQGIAYQQILSCGVPILAYDRGGFWCDPNYYPKVRFAKGVSSVPYWNDDCGEKFSGIEDFEFQLTRFINSLSDYNPRKFIIDNLSLEKSTFSLMKILDGITKIEENKK